MVDVSLIKANVDEYFANLIDWGTSPSFYIQLLLIFVSALLAYFLAATLKSRSGVLKEEPKGGAYLNIRLFLYRSRDLLFPLFLIATLAISVDISEYLNGNSWVVRAAEGVAVIIIIYTVIMRFVTHPLVRSMIKWVVIPVVVLHVFGWLDEVTKYLDTLVVEVGNIKVSAYGIARVVFFGVILFWFGRLSNRVGQRIIRKQDSLEAGTREIFAKVFQVIVFFIIFLLLLQVMGVNLTALAVFGGALGVGLGFGLQAIASNFISGIILLLDRSLSVGDYIELPDGRKGTIRELNMRSTLLETFDGKDIMVPNEQFITSSFTNWTHKNKKQRYSLELQVAYSTDLHKLFEILRKVVASHPQVLSGPDLPFEERPDAEISGFGDFGVNILIEFWMEGIDDGENRVGADLLLMIWDALHENNIEIPFPQREIRILNKQNSVAESR